MQEYETKRTHTTVADSSNENAEKTEKPPVVAPRVEALRQAATIIQGERDDTYGGPEDNFARIAKIWSVIFAMEVTPTQVAAAMAGVKLARLVNSPDHADSWVDLAGYAACGYEVSKRSRA